MSLKFAVASLAVLCLLATPAAVVYPDCHDTTYCEHVVSELVDMYWDEPYNNTVDYLVNVDYRPRPENNPSLASTDIGEAAGLWRNVRYKGVTLWFNPRDMGITDEKAERYDQTNVISWLGIRDHNLKARVTAWPVSAGSKEIEEADMAFNYYINYVVHAEIADNPDSYCLKAMAAHEWGHFAGLEDARPDFCDGQYTRYTMFKTPWSGTANCAKETLECEDKFALHHTYTVLNQE